LSSLVSVPSEKAEEARFEICCRDRTRYYCRMEIYPMMQSSVVLWRLLPSFPYTLIEIPPAHVILGLRKTLQKNDCSGAKGSQ